MSNSNAASDVLADSVVRITLDSKGVPVPDRDPVTAERNKQKVRWLADFDFQITVDGYTDVVHSHEGGKGYSCKTGFFSGKTYKYTITANGVDNDPTIDIKP